MAWGVSQEVWGINPLDGEITLAFSTKVKNSTEKAAETPEKREGAVGRVRPAVVPTHS